MKKEKIKQEHSGRGRKEGIRTENKGEEEEIEIEELEKGIGEQERK